MSSRIGLRLLSRPFRPTPFLRSDNLNIRKRVFRKCQQRAASSESPGSTVTSTTTAAAPQNLLQRLWTSEVGVKTVHFWAPVMKWALVLAGVGDFFRPVEKLSLTQNLALTATGSIWTRWSLIIKPKNYLLAAVNCCLGIVGVIQVGRILTFQTTHTETSSLEEAVKVNAEKEKQAVQGLKEDVKNVTTSTGR